MSDNNSKLTSRKFFIVLVWLIILAALITLAFLGKVSEIILEKVLGYFFGVCMLYLGVNVAQKGLSIFTPGQGDEKECTQ